MSHTNLLTQHDTRGSFDHISWLLGTIGTRQGDRSIRGGVEQFSRTEGSAPEGRIVIKCEDDREPRWFRATAQNLIDLLELPENWDSYGAPLIDRNIVSYVLQLLYEMMRDDTPPPAVVPTNRGGVQLEWHTRGIDLEIEIQAPGHIVVSYEDNRSRDEWEAELTADLTRLSDALSELSRRG